MLPRIPHCCTTGCGCRLGWRRRRRNAAASLCGATTRGGRSGRFWRCNARTEGKQLDAYQDLLKVARKTVGYGEAAVGALGGTAGAAVARLRGEVEEVVLWLWRGGAVALGGDRPDGARGAVGTCSTRAPNCEGTSNAATMGVTLSRSGV